MRATFPGIPPFEGPNATPVPTEDVLSMNLHNLSVLAPGWFTNLRENLPTITRDLEGRDGSILAAGMEFASKVSRPDLVALCVSGPSLDETVEDLLGFPGIILAGATSLGTLLAHGVRPHGVLVVDKNPTLAMRISLIPAPIRAGIALLAPPTIAPVTLNEFDPTSRYYYHAHIDGVDAYTCPGCEKKTFVTYESPDNYPLNTVMRWILPELGIWVLQAGSVGSVLPGVVSRFQGSYESRGGDGTWRNVGPSIPEGAKILLYGYDHAYPRARARASTFTWGEHPEGAWIPRAEPPAPLHLSSALKITKGASGREILSDMTQLVYKRTLLTWWYLGWHRDDLPPQHIYVVQRDIEGALREFPIHEGWEDVDSAPFYPREYVQNAYTTYMGGSGVIPGVSSGLDGRDPTPDEINLENWR